MIISKQLIEKKNSSFKKRKIQLLLYFLRMGWASTNKSLILPDKDSSWTSKNNIFENEDILLEWNNNQGIKLKEKYHLMKTS